MLRFLTRTLVRPKVSIHLLRQVYSTSSSSTRTLPTLIFHSSHRPSLLLRAASLSLRLETQSTTLPSRCFASRTPNSDSWGELDSHVEEIADAEKLDTTMTFEDLGLSKKRVELLRAKGLAHPFPIQSRTFADIAAGRDVVGRARTGTGKTLAFALPVIESIDPKRVCDSPHCIVVVPTRELAVQVCREFEWVAPDLTAVAVYGGVPVSPQERALGNFPHIVVGTPGRIMDHIDRGTLRLSTTTTIVLDEADQMLDKGFKDDVEFILRKCNEKTQILLFSATVPRWVTEIAKAWMQKPKLIDLVGKQAVPDTIKHLMIKVADANRESVLADVLAIYTKERAIVFTDTKREAGELAMSKLLPGAEALHGDISQAAREHILAAFRAGKIQTLVTTDVAARGIDVPNVDIVIQYKVPATAAAYIHRSGRCGRAGKSGISVVLCSNYEIDGVRAIENRIGKSMVVSDIPSLSEVIQADLESTMSQLDTLPEYTSKYFEKLATQMIAEQGPLALSKAFALLTGLDARLKPTSLLDAAENSGAGTVRIRFPGKRATEEAALQAIRELEVTLVGKVHISADRQSAFFDLPVEQACKLLTNTDHKYTIDLPRSLPAMLSKERKPFALDSWTSGSRQTFRTTYVDNNGTSRRGSSRGSSRAGGSNGGRSTNYNNSSKDSYRNTRNSRTSNTSRGGGGGGSRDSYR